MLEHRGWSGCLVQTEVHARRSQQSRQSPRHFPIHCLSALTKVATLTLFTVRSQVQVGSPSSKCAPPATAPLLQWRAALSKQDWSRHPVQAGVCAGKVLAHQPEPQAAPNPPLSHASYQLPPLLCSDAGPGVSLVPSPDPHGPPLSSP